MKKQVFSLLVAALLGLTLMGTAMAQEKNRRKTVTFTEDVLLNDRLIEKGTYQVRFDASGSTLTIMKDGDVVATTKATVELREKKALYNSVQFTTTDKGKLMTGLTFEGDRRAILVGDNATQPAGEER